MCREVLTFSVADIDPSRERVFRAMGIVSAREAPGEIQSLYEDAHRLYEETARPRGMYAVIPRDDFRDIYAGEGQNAAVTPVALACEDASLLALYVFTLGEGIDRRLNRLMRQGESPLGFALDTIASESADEASRIAEARFNERTSTPQLKAVTLLYSPGYCGWHLTAQRKLFARLGPETIGVTLNSACMMTPVKSVSGVLIAGAPSVHRHGPDFDFCPECKTRTCRLRIP